MKRTIIALFLIVMICGIATAQWTKVYQTDSCDCFLDSRVPLSGMEFFGHDSGVVCSGGYNGETALTLDSGLTWNENHLDSSVSEGVGGGAFNSVNHIWFSSEAFVYHTNNVGKTWEIDTNHDPLTGLCVYFVDSLVGYEGGYEQSVDRTSDGGKNWQQVHGPVDDSGDFDVYQIQFCTPKLGLAICGNIVALIMRTTDSGMTWKLTTPSYWAQFGPAKSLSFPDPHDGWFTDGVSIFYSSDTGSTWIRACGEIAPQSQFRSISFVDSVHGIAIATSGLDHTDPLIIGYTSDGGQSWQTTSIDSEANDDGFTSFPDTNTAYAGGFDAVYKLNFGDLAVPAVPVVNSNVQSYPNPFSQSTEITFTSPSAGYAEVSIVNMLGVEVARLFSGEVGAGEHLFTWDAGKDACITGVYECLVRMNGQVETLPVVLMH